MNAEKALPDWAVPIQKRGPSWWPDTRASARLGSAVAKRPCATPVL